MLITASHAQFIGEVHKLLGCPMELCQQQCFLNSLLHMKHENVTRYIAYQRNWSCSTLKDDVFFISSCINHGLAIEMVWHDVVERACQNTLHPHFPRYIGIIGGTHVMIWKPLNNMEHSKWLDSCKKM